MQNEEGAGGGGNTSRKGRSGRKGGEAGLATRPIIRSQPSNHIESHQIPTLFLKNYENRRSQGQWKSDRIQVNPTKKL
jgi:hypothetical protein